MLGEQKGKIFIHSCITIQVFFLCAASLSNKFARCEDKSFVIITASYNNKDWYQKNVESVFMQNYKKWRLIYIDDCSTDGTADLVAQLTEKYNNWDKVALTRNKKRIAHHLANQYKAIHSCNNNEVVVILDGDDWFAHENVLTILNEAYQNPDVWMTYGQYKKAIPRGARPVCREIPQEIIEKNSIREYPWVLSHARTFYAGLFKLIKLKDLTYKENFFPMLVDFACMFPMFEMAGEKHKFISEEIYVYNNINQLNFHKQKEHLLIRNEIEKFIRTMPRYKKISAFNNLA